MQEQSFQTKFSNKAFFSKASDGDVTKDMTKIFNDGDFTLQYE
jgi:hypothetical protein